MLSEIMTFVCIDNTCVFMVDSWSIILLISCDRIRLCKNGWDFI